MRTELARTVPAACLAVAMLSTWAPDPTLVAGDTTSPATVSPPTSSTPSTPPVLPTTPTPRTTPGPRTSPAGDASVDGRPAPEGVDPERIRIPAISVDADVDDMGLNDDGSIEVPTAFADTGWWTYSPRPGRVGASAILGHVDSRTGPAVFFRLTELRPGDRIHVDGADGTTVSFAVRAIEQHAKASFPSAKVFGATPRPTLRLITCGGAFDRDVGSHVDNVVVFADLVATSRARSAG